LELLVAIALLFIVLSAVYQSFRIHIQAMTRGREIQQETFSVRLVFDVLQRDLQSAFWEAEAQGTEEGEASSRPPLFLVQSRADEEGRPRDRIAFLTIASSSGPRPSELVRVREVDYRMVQEEDAEGRLHWVLVRREDDTPDEDLLTGGEQWVLARDLQGFEVICSGAQGEPTRGWDSRVQGGLPREVAVRIWPSRSGEGTEDASPYLLHVEVPVSEGTGS
jgi:type II secretory pathway component PulJ